MSTELDKPLCLARTLVHPTGVRIQTPLLVPSISSKGFGKDGAGRSEAWTLLEVAQEFVTDSILISAYDVGHGHIPEPEDPVTDLMFVDSGGYEVSDVQDLSATYFEKAGAEPWPRELYRAILARWRAHVPAVLVSYDHPEVRIPVSEQVAAARADFALKPGQWHCLLVKPSKQRQSGVQLREIKSAIEDLAEFDVLGFTEKELGNSLLDRMVSIAQIRSWLNEAESGNPPIHVFGALDPQTVVLYSMAGAEIFDGLTWLRYGYADGIAVYYQNHGAREFGVRASRDSVKLRTLTNNYHYLRLLEDRLRMFRLDYDWSRWGADEAFYRHAWETLKVRID